MDGSVTGRESADDILQAMVSYVVEISEGKLRDADIDRGVDIFDYGYVDSLTVVQLLDFIEERWGVNVPETQTVGRLNTLKALAEFIAS